MRKTFSITMILAISTLYFLSPLGVDAKSQANTLAELRKELKAYQDKQNAANNNKAKTQNQINSDKQSIVNAQNEIEKNKGIIEQAKKDIEVLSKDIEDTEEKIENIMKSYEISNGDNAYLEYIYNAVSISDFIVRYSVSEQLANYNDELITSYEEKITENEELQKELNQREKDLNNKIDDLEVAINNLGNKLSSYVEEALDAADDIKSTQQLIKYYESMGCKENEDFNTCVKVRAASGFIRPLVKGVITSPYGYRTHPVTKQPYKFHTGTDIAGNALGTKVYSAANGMVGKIITKASCGGNQVYIFHTINGTKYTTGYMHLHSINVKVGDAVTQDTVIGTVGGNESYEQCSTGAHLHFMVGKGWYGSTYVSYSTWVSNLVNPVTMVKFPSNNVYFYTRY